MVASLSSPTDICNDALRRIGWKMRIGSLYDGSEAAKICLDIYGQTRDQLISDGNFDFEERSVVLTLLKQAPPGGYFPPTVWTPIYPALPWGFEYSLPSDFLKVRSVRFQPTFNYNVDPQFNHYSLDNDNGLVPPQRVLLCNVPSAILSYAAQVSDPSAWDIAFTESFAAALGRRLAPALVGLDATKLAAADEQTEKAVADNTQE